MQSPLSPVQQFILDCADVASTLDALHTRNHHRLHAALLSGRVEYQSLVQRREDLSPSTNEEAWVGLMLDGLLARLRFLESRLAMNAPGLCELCS